MFVNVFINMFNETLHNAAHFFLNTFVLILLSMNRLDKHFKFELYLYLRSCVLQLKAHLLC